MTEVLFFLVTGLCLGSGYALAALGIATLFNGTGILNFAQGDFVMVSALFTAIVVSREGSYWLSVLVAAAGTAIIGALVGLLFIRPTKKTHRDIDLLVLGTVGVSIILANLATVTLGRDTYSLVSPWAAAHIGLQGYKISADYLVMLAVSVVAFLGFMLLYQKTDLGLQMRAISADVNAARYSGVPVVRLTIIGWALAGLTGAVAGTLLGTVLLVSSAMGLTLTISAFAAAMIGGLKNPWGALLGGVIMGLAETFAAGYFGTAIRQAIAPLVIITVLLLLPGGILAQRRFKARAV